jgi:hypothetical protein
MAGQQHQKVASELHQIFTTLHPVKLHSRLAGREPPAQHDHQIFTTFSCRWVHKRIPALGGWAGIR